MFFCSFAFSEDFNLICDGERKVRNLSGKKLNDGNNSNKINNGFIPTNIR